MKGKIMTTENTTTEATTESTSTEASMTPMEFAEDFIKNNSITDIAEQLVTYSETVDNLNRRIARQVAENDNLRRSLQDTVNTITEFLKSHIGENDSASVDELKELADELDIEMSKSITVKMQVEIEVEMTVPIDFDEESIDDSDFDISCEFSRSLNDVEVDDTNINVESCEVEEN